MSNHYRTPTNSPLRSKSSLLLNACRPLVPIHTLLYPVYQRLAESTYLGESLRQGRKQQLETVAYKPVTNALENLLLISPDSETVLRPLGSSPSSTEGLGSFFLYRSQWS